MSQLTSKNELHHESNNGFDDNEEFQNIEKQINNQIGKITTGIGCGLNKLKTFGRQKSSRSSEGMNSEMGWMGSGRDENTV